MVTGGGGNGYEESVTEKSVTKHGRQFFVTVRGNGYGGGGGETVTTKEVHSGKKEVHSGKAWSNQLSAFFFERNTNWRKNLLEGECFTSNS